MAGRCATSRCACSRTVPAAASTRTCCAQWSDDVILFSDRHPIADEERATLDARAIAVVDGHVERLVIADERVGAVRVAVDGHVEHLVVAHDRLHAGGLADGRASPRAAVFIRPAARAHADALGAALGCETHGSGLLRTDAGGAVRRAVATPST